jgi:hypothetical protein
MLRDERRNQQENADRDFSHDSHFLLRSTAAHDHQH